MKGSIRAVARDAHGVELHTVYKDPHDDIGLCLCIATVDVECVIDRLRGGARFRRELRCAIRGCPGAMALVARSRRETMPCECALQVS